MKDLYADKMRLLVQQRFFYNLKILYFSQKITEKIESSLKFWKNTLTGRLYAMVLGYFFENAHFLKHIFFIYTRDSVIRTPSYPHETQLSARFFRRITVRITGSRV